ncbi:MAG: NRDE family protein [Cyclobacteriaceae bacterium]|nr:NRDE family protein [Cyclobacteriaceae bacterium]
MCLIFLSVNYHPKYKLIVAANRDEFYKRKTAAAHYWEDHPDILGGRDLEAQGTWMAMTKEGRIGMVTNYRDLSNINPTAPSRGKLVSDFLLSEASADEYLKDIHESASEYNGFNLILGTPEGLSYYSNYQSKIIKLDAGFYGLSNHLLNTPWPKVERGKSMMSPILQQDQVEPDLLFEVLRDEKIAMDSELPKTGLELERERALSAMFIKTPNYGSRCSTVIMIDKKNNVNYIERVYDLDTFEYDTRSYTWSIN